jgi:thymidylate synthase
MLNYSEICGEIMEGEECSPRGMRIKEILACQVELEPDDILVEHDLIPSNEEYLNAELNWYIKGDIEDLSIADHARLWREHIQDGKLNSNYGYWLGPHGNDQLRNAIDVLREDRDSRRAIALIGDPGCVMQGQRDVPCTQSIQFFIRAKQLITIVNMRSQDLWFGFRNDVPFFQCVAQVVAKIMNAPVHRTYINVGSLHVYERHWPKMKELMEAEHNAMANSYDLSDYVERMVTEWKLDK